MGQGLYGAIGFGVILSEEQHDALFDEDGECRFDAGGWDNEPKRSYESEDLYLAFLIFDTAGYTTEGGDQRYAVRLDRLAEDTRERYPKAYAEAEEAWASFAAKAKAFGVDLPDGGLIYVHDYD